MKLTCLMPVRNEDWILGLTARAALMACDELVLMDHCSTDGTPDIIREVTAEHPGRVHVCRSNDPVWHECQYRQMTLDMARDYGATHLALIDADEILTGNLVDSLRGFVADSTPQLQLPWLCLARSLDRRYASGVWGTSWVSCGFPDSPQAHWLAPAGYDFHHRHPWGLPEKFARPIRHDQGGLMHLQFLSERRLRAKQALYKMIERIRWPTREPIEKVNQRYNYAVYDSLPTAHKLADVPEDWWWVRYGGLMRFLDIDAAPWQEAECKRLLAEHGPEKFLGLDLFGVI